MIGAESMAAFSGVQAAGGAAADQAASSSAAPGRGGAGRKRLLSPGTTVGCRIAMGVTMALMLFIMN
jgi:hypothetical protein